MERKTVRKVVLALIATLAWFGIAGQVYLAIDGAKPGSTLPGILVNTFSYWTLQSNLFVALACTLPLGAPRSALGRFSEQPIVRMAPVVYIATTGIIYGALLAGLWQPSGFQAFVATLQHYIIPVLYPLAWLLVDDHGRLQWRTLPALLIYPLVYLVYSLVRGGIIDDYPYPFIDVLALGMGQVLINSAVLTAIFLLMGAGLVALDRVASQRMNRMPLGESPQGEK